MFNISGSEIIIILLLALIVLGPEKLPDAMRKFGQVYRELRNMSSGFQSEMRSAFEEPIRELRETAELTKQAVMQPLEDDASAGDALDPGRASDPMTRHFQSQSASKPADTAPADASGDDASATAEVSSEQAADTATGTAAPASPDSADEAEQG